MCLKFLPALMVFAMAAPAMAGDKPGFKFRTELRFQMLNEENVHFGSTNDDSTASQSIELRERVTYIPTDNIKIYWEGRAVKMHGEGGGVDFDSGSNTPMKSFLEWRQSWVEFDDLLGYDPLAIQIGRQRFKEEKSLWWNRDFDAVRLAYKTDSLRAFVAGGQNLAAYRTSQDDFEEDDRDIARLLSEVSWDYMTGHTVEFRAAYQDDRSGLENIGSLIRTNDRDNNDQDLFWGGARIKGKFENTGAVYSLDLMGVTGKSNNLTSAATADPSLRRVTGSNRNDVLGWALDASLHAPIPGLEKTSAVFGYAYGSGDSTATNSTDHGFRQLELRSNYSRHGLLENSFSNYGSILRPELTNLHILTGGLIVPLFKDSDLTALYHYYRLDDDTGRLGSTGISSPLTAGKADLGHAIDVMLNVNLTKEFGLSERYFDKIEFKTNVGVFRAGSAYGAEDGEYTFRGVSELRFSF